MRRRTVLKGAAALPIAAGLRAAPPPPAAADTLLRYDAAATKWTEALPIGNGRMGAMVWGGAGLDRLQLNETSLWSGEPFDNVNPAGKASIARIRELLLAGDDKAAQALVERDLQGRNNQSYQPVGALLLDFGAGDVADYARTLDLAEGVATTRFTAGGVTHSRDYLASHTDDVIVVRLAASRAGALSFAARLDSPHPHRVSARDETLLLTGRAPSYSDPHYVEPAKLEYQALGGAAGMTFATRVAVVAEGGRVRCTDGRITVEGADAATVIVAIATSYAGPRTSPSRAGVDPVVATAAAVARAAKPWRTLRADHVAHHAALFGRVSLSLGTPSAATVPARLAARDPLLPQLYYQFGRYLLIATSRPGGQPANLQGLWNKDVNPFWSANWTLNCNAQINYWGAEAAGLPECHQALLGMTQDLAIDGRHVARDLYGAGGWMAHHNTDIWHQAAPVGGSAQWTIFQCGSAWLCQHLWEHYAFNGSRAYLASIWPTLRDAARYYTDTMVTDPATGHRLTAPDVAFENVWRRPDGHSGVVCMGPTGNMQMVRQLFENCLEAARILGRPASETAAIGSTLPKLPPMRVSPTNGQLQEWQQDWQRTIECMVMSVWGAVCAAQITPRGTPALAAALRKIYDDEGWWKKDRVGSWQGAFQAMVYARLHDGDTALAVIERHLATHVNANLSALFQQRVEWQIDGNLGIMAAIGELLMQSHAGEIDLLPALPGKWRDGTVRGLRARARVEVDLEWAAGTLRRATLRNPTGRKMTVRHGDRVRTLAARHVVLDAALATIA